MYTLSNDTLAELLNDQPSFRRFILLRAVRRRSHFLKILDDVQQFTELQHKYQKQRFASQMEMYIDEGNLRADTGQVHVYEAKKGDRK